MAARFKMKRKGVGELLRSEMIRVDLGGRRQEIESVAVALSPVGGPGGGRRRDRAVAYVRNGAYYARWVEYGTERVPAHHVLLRAAQAGGG